MPSSIPGKTAAALELFRAYRAIQIHRHELNYLFWECTLRCNLHCVHCGSDCKTDSNVKDMPLSDFLKVVDEVRSQLNPNNVMIAITGGEPLMRADLEACGKALYERGFPWGIVTNGYALTKKRLDSLLSNGLRSVTVSLDGLKGPHDWFRGKSGSFEKACGAIRLCAAASDLVFDVATCVHQKNFGELAEIRDLLVSFGVKQWRLFTVFSKGRAGGNTLLRLSAGQFRGVMDFIETTRNAGAINAKYGCEGFLGAYEGRVRDHLFFCNAGVNVGSVLVDGSISACPSLRNDYIQGSIYKDSFMECWNRRYQKMRERSWTKTGACERCKVYKFCQGNSLHLRDEKTGELMFCHYAAING